MVTPYRPNWLARLGNRVATALVRSGLRVGVIVLLTVRGRTSGQPRTTPIAIVEQQGHRYLVATFGIVDWVRNLRAAGEATLTRGRRTEAVTVVELSAAEAAPILQAIAASGPGFARARWGVTAQSSLDDFRTVVDHHPVFRVQAADGHAVPQLRHG